MSLVNILHPLGEIPWYEHWADDVFVMSSPTHAREKSPDLTTFRRTEICRQKRDSEGVKVYEAETTPSFMQEWIRFRNE